MQHRSTTGLRGIWENKWRFLPTFFLIFFLTLSVLSLSGILPDSLTEEETAEQTSETPIVSPSSTSASATAVEPVRLVIKKVGIDALIVNPVHRDIPSLDQALKSGVVRYPGTGLLDEDGTMFLFGHSSYLPVVYNRAYQSLNYLQRLEKGDLINVESDTKVYLYRVSSVVKENAAEAKVDLTRRDRHLVIATCDSFGKQSDRYVVDAEYVGSYAK